MKKIILILLMVFAMVLLSLNVKSYNTLNITNVTGYSGITVDSNTDFMLIDSNLTNTKTLQAIQQMTQPQK